jgi:hypothetical protein
VGNTVRYLKFCFGDGHNFTFLIKKQKAQQKPHFYGVWLNLRFSGQFLFLVQSMFFGAFYLHHMSILDGYLDIAVLDLPESLQNLFQHLNFLGANFG